MTWLSLCMHRTISASRTELGHLTPKQGANTVIAGPMYRAYVESRNAPTFIPLQSTSVGPPFVRKLSTLLTNFVVIPHTPCLAWPNCVRGALCAYKHPEPLIPKVPELPVTTAMSFQPQPPSPVQVIPSGTVQFHGTTYFPQGRAQPPVANMPSPPQYSWNYSPIMQSVPSGYSPESLPFHSPYYETMTISGVPAAASVPRAFTGVGPDLSDLRNLASAPTYTLSPDSVSSAMTRSISEEQAKLTEPVTSSATDEDSPYQAPPPGKHGHARRVSVAMRSKEDSDAVQAAPVAPPRKTTRRESWMGHRGRDEPTHRVSASGMPLPHGRSHH
jgi:hypothetical protein